VAGGVKVCIILVAMFMLWPGAGLRAHALDPGFLELQALGGETWRVLWRVPIVDGRPMAIGLTLPGTCVPADVPELDFDGRAYTAQWVVSCPEGIEGGEIAIPGLEATQTDVLVRYELMRGEAESHRLTSATTAFVIPAPMGRVGVLTSYGALGVSHILTGVDHLLFVFILLLLIRDGRTLLGAVTAFTVAHSLSLAAAALGWIVVPAPPVEAVVALSIMFLAAELMRPEGRGLRLTDRYPWSVAFGFGLLHGLGFARALLEIGLPEGEVPLALFAFNLGVEAGQILFILFAVYAGVLLRRLYPAVIVAVTTRGAVGARAVGYVAGGLAGVWFVARVATF
jgi:hypothetical protein